MLLPIFPELTVVTVNLNLEHDTVACIKSLIQAGALLNQIIIVDNASQQKSVEFIRKTFNDAITIIENQENLGYASGLNQGIRRFLENPQSDWVLLINNDTLVHEDFLTELAKIAYQENYRLLGPVIYYYSDPDKIWALGDRIIPGTMLFYHLLKNKALVPNIENPLQVDMLNGCAMLIHRSVFEDIGDFDTSFFMYAEEVDFFWRARMYGYKMACVTKAKMWHKVSASSSQMRGSSLHLQVRNQITFYRRYGKNIQLGFIFIFSCFRSSIQGIKFLVKGLPKHAKAIFTGWYEGWFGKSIQ